MGAMWRNVRGHEAAFFVNSIPFIALLTFFSFSGCTKEGPAGPQGPPGGEDLTNPAVQPKVIFTYPSTTATGPFDIYNRGEGSSKPHFVVRFNKLMSVHSLLPGKVTCRGFDRPVSVVLNRPYFAGEDYLDIMSFVIVDSAYQYIKMNYRLGQTYTIAIDSTLEDINGNYLGHRITFSFKPEPSFRVLAISPRDGSKDVERSSTPTIIFNSPIDTSIVAFVGFSPQPGGTWTISQYDSFAVLFLLRNPLAYDSSYTVSVGAGARDVHRNQISRAITSTFTTTAFRVSFPVAIGWKPTGSRSRTAMPSASSRSVRSPAPRASPSRSPTVAS